MPTTRPTYQADGFRDERCARCGDVIGFAFFDARVYYGQDGDFVQFLHKDRDSYAAPDWCQPKDKDAPRSHLKEVQ